MASQKCETTCRLFKRCGGCQLSMSYEEQLLWKQERVERRFSRFIKPDTIIGMEKPFHYRNKTTAVVREQGRGRLLSGVFQSSTNSVVATDDCMLEDKRSLKIIKTARELMRELKISAYNPKTDKGTVKYFLVRQNTNGQALLLVVTSKNQWNEKHLFAKLLSERCKNVTTISAGVSRSRDKLVLPTECEILTGEGFITDKLCSKTFEISPLSFYQINHTQTEKLYSLALDMAQLRKSDTMLDCYCGIGTIGIIASDRVKKVMGVEKNSFAIEKAKRNASLCGVTNAEFTNADAGEFMARLVEKGEKPDAVIMDPARMGCDRRFLQSLTKLSPERIVYISCNIETQERDVKELVKQGYEVKRVAPVDMFPHTTHIECVVLLMKR